MPKTVTYTKTLYQFDELDDDAKETAREWFRMGQHETFEADFVIESFETACKILGVELSTNTVDLYGGGTREKVCVYWSGFCSQGDGASFEGYYGYAKNAAHNIKKEFGENSELIEFAERFQTIQKANFYQLEASISQNSFHCHARTMSINVTRESANYQDMNKMAEGEITDILQDLADWLYRRLESEYNWLFEDEQIDDGIKANEYTFDENGNRED